MMHNEETAAATIDSSNPSVAVVIPFYNGSSFIERCLRSVFEQTIPASEVIVVDDGSNRDEHDRLNALAASHPIRIIKKENGGQGSARNAGVAASTSNFICFLDQDDFFLPNHIEILSKAIPANDPLFGFVYAELYEADQDGNVLYTSIVKRYSKQFPKQTVFDMLRHDMFVLPSASLVSRAAFDAVGGFDVQFIGYEDDDLFLRIFRKGYSNCFVDRAVTVWCIHTESTSHGMLMTRSRFRYFKKLVDMFPDQPGLKRYYLRDYLAPRFGQLFIEQAIKAAESKTAYREELLDNLKTYAAVVASNPYIRLRYKLKLKCLVHAVENSLPTLSKVISRLPANPGTLAQLR